MNQSRKATKVAYQRLKELVKFGKFVEVEDTPAASSINAEVAKEHVAPKPKFQFAFQEVEISDDDDDDDDDDDVNNDDDDDDDDDGMDFCMFVPSKEPVNEAVISPAETEKEINIFKQPNDPTPEQMEALIEQLQSTARKPPQAVPVTPASPSGSDKENSSASLMPSKRKRRDPRPGVLISDQVQKEFSTIELDSMAQNIPSPVTESIPVIQEISSLLPESSPMDQDFQIPIIEDVVLSSEGAQASGSSFEALELDISKGKSKLHESEFVDVALLQNKVFDLEQSSAEKDLIIGKQDIRISDLEKENSIKDAKIS
ncbi:unnamed protein product [Lactuca virosa]|uniref:Uncharacterized protein n=1 Tax=Lactuca virosa TaxID=75947 RepID=A0AAU9M7C5_9ASTR|nr:unnamed protein product [Lactuca virosa]